MRASASLRFFGGACVFGGSLDCCSGFRRILYAGAYAVGRISPESGRAVPCSAVCVCRGIRKPAFRSQAGVERLVSVVCRMRGHTQVGIAVSGWCGMSSVWCTTYAGAYAVGGISPGSRRKAVAPCRVLRFTHAWAYTNWHDGSRVGRDASHPYCDVCRGIRGAAHSNRPCALRHVMSRAGRGTMGVCR